jgi:energy-coupling factor transporter ATP-binding protein EcfA2
MASIMIRLADLTFTYAGEPAPALTDLSFEIPTGQFWGLIGPNGAGKSTLCYAISGMIPHYFKGDLNGVLNVNGIEIAQSSLGELAGKIGLVFQNPFNQISGSRFTVRGEVALGLENLGIPRKEIVRRVRAALDQSGLGEVAGRSPFALSGGQQQRLAIASILVMQPEVLILDEPTSQLDPVGTREVFSLLHDLVEGRETTVLIAEHKLEQLAEFSDQVLVLDQGKLSRHGPPEHVLNDSIVEQIGVQPTRYTQAGREAKQRGLVKSKGKLPITLADADAYFHEHSV